MMSGVESPAGTFVHRPAGAEEARGAGILAGSEVGFRRFFETFCQGVFVTLFVRVET